MRTASKQENRPYLVPIRYAAPVWLVNVAPQAGLIMENVNGDDAAKNTLSKPQGVGL